MSQAEKQANLSHAVMMVSDIYISETDKVRIAQDLGEETVQALLTLYEDTIGCDVDWNLGSMDAGLKALGKVLDEKYPWLTEEAQHRISHWFMMVWK